VADGFRILPTPDKSPNFYPISHDRDRATVGGYREFVGRQRAPGARPGKIDIARSLRSLA
jgi:hypothetical protein